jgi:hypothetical protein
MRYPALVVRSLTVSDMLTLLHIPDLVMQAKDVSALSIDYSNWDTIETRSKAIIEAARSCDRVTACPQTFTFSLQMGN